MPIRTVKKNKSTKTCSNCKGNVAGNATKCQNCGSTKLMKSLVVVRKSEATGEDAGLSDTDLETASELSESEDVEDIEDDDIEDLEEDDFEPADDDEEDESDEDEEDDDEAEEEEDESEEESDDEEEEEPVKKRVVRRRAVSKSVASEEILADIALVGLALIDDVSKSLGDDEAYEDAMNDLNHNMDAIHEAAANGNSISKEDRAAKLKRLKARLATLKAKLAGGGDDDEDEDDVEKSDDIYRGLTPEAAEIVRKSQELIEKNTTEQFETIAKSYGELPTSTQDLGAALRFLSDNNPDMYNVITKALGGAAYAVQQSSIFKSFGSAQSGEETQGSSIDVIAKNFQEKDPSLSPEQARVKAMQERPDLYHASLRG